MSSENFAKLYKNAGKHDDNRRRRTETSVEIRKQRGKDLMMKRRNLAVDLNDEFNTSASDTEEQQKQQTAAAAATDQQSQPSAPELMTLPKALEVLKESTSIEQIRAAFESVRKVLSRSADPPINTVVEMGFPLALVQALSFQDEKVQFEAAWSLTNIVSGTSEQTEAIVKAGAIPPLIKLAAHSSTKLAEQALWAIANIVGDGVQMRDAMFANGIVPLLVDITTAKKLAQFDVSFARILSWTISNLCRYKKPQAPFEVLAALAPAIVTLLKYDDMQTQTDACWALSYLTDGADENIELALNENAVPQLVRFVKSKIDALISPALRTLGNFATGNDALTQVVIDTGLLTDRVPSLLASSNMAFAKECCWLLSNILAGSPEQIQDVIDAKLLPILFRILENGEHKLQYEVGWALANLAHGGTANQIMEIYRVKHAIEAICSNLEVKNNELVANMLETLYTTLQMVSTNDPDLLHKLRERVEECGGIDKIEKLQHHEAQHIYEAALKIIEEFFSEEEDEDDSNVTIAYNMENMEPETAAAQGPFNF